MTHSRVDTIYNWWNRILCNLGIVAVAIEGFPMAHGSRATMPLPSRRLETMDDSRSRARRREIMTALRVIQFYDDAATARSS